MSDLIPHHALIVVADGHGARFFRNNGRDFKVELVETGSLSPSADSGGPAGHRPVEENRRETHEAAFAKQLADELYRRAQSGDYDALVLIADPQTLGQIRPSLHSEVKKRLTADHAKSLTKSPVKEIEKALS